MKTFWKPIPDRSVFRKNLCFANTVSKIYERFLYDQINEYFKPLFSKLQYGFRRGHSVQHCLLALIENSRKVLDKRGFAGLRLNNFPKTFNWFDHDLLTAYLHDYGFNIKSLKPIHSYLHDRINSLFSHSRNKRSGIP